MLKDFVNSRLEDRWVFLRVDDEDRGALFSRAGAFRFLLTRVWGTGPLLAVLGVNPSTAGVQDDPTVRKLRGFARANDYAGFFLMNLFPLVATNQRELLRYPRSRGEDQENDDVLKTFCVQRDVLVAWGCGKNAGIRALIRERAAQVMPLLAESTVWCLGRTKDGYPCHPLMLPYSTQFERWEVA